MTDIKKVAQDTLDRVAVATAEPWEDAGGYNGGGCPTMFLKIPGHNQGKTVEMLAEDVEFIIHARGAARVLAQAVLDLSAREEALLEIIHGRTTMPTEAEMVAHKAAGGLWRWVSMRDGTVIHGCSEDGAPWIYNDPLETIPLRIGSTYTTRYWALDATRQLCPWPKATP